MKFPFPSLKYSRSNKAKEFFEKAIPPLQTNKSISLSISASKKSTPVSSDSLSLLKTLSFDKWKPDLFCINKLPELFLAPPTKKSSIPSPFTSATAILGPSFDFI